VLRAADSRGCGSLTIQLTHSTLVDKTSHRQASTELATANDTKMRTVCQHTMMMMMMMLMTDELTLMWHIVLRLQGHVTIKKESRNSRRVS